MATSPLAAALKPTVSGSEEADARYTEALKQLSESLENRQRMFDPQLLALAQGFAAPTQTGGFFESMGYGAKAVGEAQKEQEKEDRERIAARLQLAQAEREQASLNEARKDFARYAGIGPQGAPGTPGAAGGTSPQGGMRPVSLQDAMAYIAAHPKEKELGARMMEAAKAGLDRFQISMNGIVFDRMEGKYLNADIPGQTQSDFATPFGTFKMTPNQHSRFEMAQQAGLGKEWMEAFRQGNQFQVDQLVAQRLGAPTAKPAGATGSAPAAVTPAAGAPSAPAAGAAMSGAQPTPTGAPAAPGRQTVAESEAQAAAARERATGMAKGEVSRYQKIMDTGESANSKIATYNSMGNVISKPGMDKLLGYFERPDFLSAAGKLIEENRFGPNAIRDILQNLGAPQELIDNKMLLNSMVNQFGVDYATVANKGQGSVSEYERQLFQSVGPSMKDPIAAFRKKVDMLKARAEFDKQVARDLRRSKMDADEFVLESPQYQSALSNYYRRLENIVYGTSGQQAAPAAGPVSNDEVVRRRNEARKRAEGG